MNDDTIIAIVLGLGGIAITWIASRWYYKKGAKETGKQINEAVSTLESLEEAKMRIEDSINPNKVGKPIKTKSGKWGVGWKRSMSEKVTVSDNVIAKVTRNVHLQEENVVVSDNVSTKVRRWHDDPNGTEIVNNRRGYYTDE